MEKQSFSLEELYIAYKDCIKNKKSSKDYLNYELEYGKSDLVKLLQEINSKTYKVGRSYCFIAYKPKIREIFASSFRDRIVHHLLVGKLEGYFEKRFYKNVFSCRKEKGALLGVKTLYKDLQKIPNCHGRAGYHCHGQAGYHCHYPAGPDNLGEFNQLSRSPCGSPCQARGRGGQVKKDLIGQRNEEWCYLQLDLKGFFMNIDKDILYKLINNHITKKNFENHLLLRYLIKEIIYNDPVAGVEKRGKLSLYKLVPKSKSLFGRPKGKGLPIGNLTSQFFANIYLNELDNYIKRDLKTAYYYRYVDDFILLGTKQELKNKFNKIEIFLENMLKLRLSENKTKLLPVTYDIDFIGYVIRAKKIILPRKRNINSFKDVVYKQKINNKDVVDHTFSSINSYLGILRNTKSYNLREKYLNKLNDIVFKQNLDYLKITKDNELYYILDSNKKPLKKYKEVQEKYKDHVIIVQVGCFYKVFDRQAIYFSEKTGLKLTIFNPKTKAERIMCGFHEKSLEKYLGLIEKENINSVVLKQIKTSDNKIEREIYKIYKFDAKNNIPIYSRETIEEIKANYYKKYLSKSSLSQDTQKDVSEKETSFLDIEKEFLKDFKSRDFKDQTYYELIEYIIKWKNSLKI
ncbi:MAG: reverse transcriptase domain-containing protein [Candidatus Gracilibacteria bacterium]|nr:reverse transcriptase domain-containing protein [Candidatus Gracilibacteria bacterium]